MYRMVINNSINMSMARVPHLGIGQRDLKCRQGCGYYGNAQFDGLCSKCFRERNDKKKKQNHLQNSTASPRIDATLPPSSSHGGVTNTSVASISGCGASSSVVHLSPQNLLDRSPRKKPDAGHESSSGTLTKKKSLVPAVFQQIAIECAKKRK